MLRKQRHRSAALWLRSWLAPLFSQVCKKQVISWCGSFIFALAFQRLSSSSQPPGSTANGGPPGREGVQGGYPHVDQHFDYEPTSFPPLPGSAVSTSKVPKFSTLENFNSCNIPDIQTKGPKLWVFRRKDANGIANSEDPDQTAPLGAVWSGSALFAQTYLSENLVWLQYKVKYLLSLHHLLEIAFWHMSRVVRKPDFCICENKDADQLRGYREADQPLCFSLYR